MRDYRKILLILFFAACSFLGFMVKLPRVFHHYDKELHTLFYVFAILLLTFLFPKRWLLATISLLLFGVFIEYAQEFSNKITIRMIGKAIHGRFDVEDVHSNFYGIILGLCIFHTYRFLKNKSHKVQV